MKRLLALLRCAIFRHDFAVQKHVRGSHPEGNWTVCLRCKRCERRYILSETFQAYFRYDDDPQLRADILRIYPWVRAEEL